MKINKISSLLCALGVFLFVGIQGNAQNTNNKSSAKKDTIAPLKYNFKGKSVGSLYLNNPSETTVVFDKKLNKYIITQRIGNSRIGIPIYMSPAEYKSYRLKKDIQDYFKEKVNAATGKKASSKEARKNLLPKYYVNSDFFESIFGGNEVEVIPTGRLNLKMGAIYQNVDNPQLSQENRSSFTFDFDQQIQAGITAKIGKRLQVTANYDTQSTFDFSNIVKLEYTPTEDDILQKIDAGNVSMPIKNSLINGAQSLFGVRADFKFGNTKIATVFSQQNSESKQVVAKGGATIQEFEFRATDYDADRHFFLSQFFRNNYQDFIGQSYPLISSPINITRVEVWVTNRTSNTEDYRSIVALGDLGETTNLINNPANLNPNLSAPSIFVNGNVAVLPENDVNDINNLLVATGGIRDISSVDAVLRPLNMSQGRDYTLLQNARKLTQNEYTINNQLGYISLNSRLADGEVLAVAYEYTVVGSSDATKQSYRVGEFSNDGIVAPDNIVVKLLRSEIIQTKRTVAGVEEAFPTWNLMMKNIYSLGTSPLVNDSFRLEVMYRDDATGVPLNVLQNAQTAGINNKTLLNLLNLDKLNQSQRTVADGDGYLDFLDGVIINSQLGYIIFPEPEPFGSFLESKLTSPSDEKYLFKELYSNTRSQAKNDYQSKDKYLLKGYSKTDASDGIPLNAFNVPKGSVKVTAGGKLLVEGVDYVVDYVFGKVQIIDAALKASGVPINVSTENNSLFNQQRKTFIGLEIEHTFSDNFTLGGTILNVDETPLTQKVNFGQEPINNTMFGLNLDYSTEAPVLTRFANMLPYVDTDAISKVSVRGDFAYLLPSTPSAIDVNGQATTYIDDFEASQISIDLLSPLQWYSASTPISQANLFFGENTDFTYNNKRAKLSWYSIDQIFYGNGQKPSNIDNDELSRAEVRQISFEELFPQQELDVIQNTLVRTLDLAYYPSERGPYNFNTANVIDGGGFSDPEDKWGGIMRPLTVNNFDKANVEYIQFWLKDPYEDYSITSQEGLPLGVNPNDISNQVGDLYINLGSVSEDILKDNRKMYENGLPTGGGLVNTTPTIWGKVPTNQSILYAFDESDEARLNQDLGLDGINDAEEAINVKSTLGLTDSQLVKFFKNDPASDNFQYYRGGNLDSQNASIISRYKRYNNTQGNSPTANQSTESYPTSSSSYPDVEDINKDQTMSSVESYWEYKISLDKNNLNKTSDNNIVDIKETNVTLPNGTTKKTTWYQFRIPVRSGEAVNGISDYNSIRFVRMFLTKFKMPVVLRFGQLELVRGDWRRYVKTLDPNVIPQRNLDKNELKDYEVGVINIEQNENRYVVPPGIVRERLQGSSSIQQQNEQSATLKVVNLPPGKTRAIFKNVRVDLRMFKQLQMFLHAEGLTANGIQDDDLKAIIRLGTDLNDNYYQIELPLKVSPENTLSPLSVWPEANNLDAALTSLSKLKIERDKNKLPIADIYPAYAIPDNKDFVIRVKGNPTLAEVRTAMLGVKNVSNSAKSAEIWFNELRAGGFDNKGGWAAVLSADANIADVMDVSLSGRMQTIGFGSVEDRVSQRSIEETRQYDVSTNVKLGKMLPPKWNIQLPMSYSIGEEFKDPKYDRQYKDVLFEDAKDVNPNSINAQDYTKRTSISFLNVKKNRSPTSKKKPKFYDIENVSVSYAFNEEFHRDYNIKKYLNQNVRASANYAHTFQSKSIEPFKKISFLNSKYLKFIKDFNFNPVPTTFAVNSRITRGFNEQESRNLIEGLSAQPVLTQRNFLFDWDYRIGLNLTKSLQLNFNATNSYIYDNEDPNEKLEIFDKFFTVGRSNHYSQKLNATYKLPLNKLPFLGFLNGSYAYTADFDWRASTREQLSQIGNVIQNANTHNLTGDINFTKLYKQVGVNTWFSGKKKKNSKNLPSPRGVRSKNKLSTGQKVGKAFVDVLTSVKKAKINYSQNNGTLLPGFIQEANFLGGPTFGFAFGSQVDIRQRAIENSWLVTRKDGDPYINKTYSTTSLKKLDYSISIKPFKNLTIDLRGNRTRTSTISEQLDVVDNNPLDNTPGVRNITPITQTGNFAITHSMFSSAFDGNGDATFAKFRANRSVISNRLALTTGLPNTATKAYKETGQQVLIPAFLAAYSGGSASSTSLGMFRNIPIPNWNLSYNGFMKMKWFKKHFRSFTLSHGYQSLYTVGNFTGNLNYEKGNVNASDNYEPELSVSSVSLIDAFSPLIRIDMKMRNNFSFKAEIKNERAMTLNLGNATLTDNRATDFVFGLGYRIKNVKFNTRLGGKKQTLKGDINLRADITLRDDNTTIRSIDVDNNQITAGQNLFNLKFIADYRLNSNLTASFYYNHNSSSYAISTTFPRQSINAGLNITYNLGN